MKFRRTRGKWLRGVAAVAMVCATAMGFDRPAHGSRMVNPLCDAGSSVRFAFNSDQVPQSAVEQLRLSAQAFRTHGGTLMATIGVSAHGEDQSLRGRRAEALRLVLVSFGVAAASVEAIESNEPWSEGLGAVLPCWHRDVRVLQRTPPVDPTRAFVFVLARTADPSMRVNVPVGYLTPLFWHLAPDAQLESRPTAYAVLPDMLPRSSLEGRACYASNPNPCSEAITVNVSPATDIPPNLVIEALRSTGVSRDPIRVQGSSVQLLEGAGPDGLQLHLVRREIWQGDTRQEIRQIVFWAQTIDGRILGGRCSAPFYAYHGSHPSMPAGEWTASMVMERMPGKCIVTVPLPRAVTATVEFDMSKLPQWRSVVVRTETMVEGWVP